MRAALIDTAARILATDGPSRLTVRHLAEQVGTSTMALYTHFGGMEQLRLEVCAEGFRRLAAHLGAVGHTDDPVADLLALGFAYTANARQNPHLYRAMFLDRLPVAAPVDVGLGVPDLPGGQAAVADDDPIGVAAPGLVAASGLVVESVATFEVLVAAMTRCVEAGRFTDPSPPRTLAAQLWGATHGLVTLELSGLVDPAQAGMLLGATARHLAIAFGDTPERFDASAAAVLERVAG